MLGVKVRFWAINRKTILNGTSVTRKRISQPKYIEYVVQVTDYRLSYFHSLNTSKAFSSDEAWTEHYTIQINGTLLAPKIKGVDAAQINILQHEQSIRNRLDDYCQDTPPKGVGSVRRRKEILDGLVSIPKDAIPTVISILQQGAFISLHGPKFGRELLVTSLNFDTICEEL